ncbi:MAG: YdcH family protein [Campylobacter sp.]
MFHEDRELITKLKNTNARFTTLFDKHNELDEKITELQKAGTSSDLEIENLKREKLKLKDEIYAFLNEYKKEHK